LPKTLSLRMLHSHYDRSKPTRQSQLGQNVQHQEREETVILKDLWNTSWNTEQGQEEANSDTDPSIIPVILTSDQYRYKHSHTFPAWSKDGSTKTRSTYLLKEDKNKEELKPQDHRSPEEEEYSSDASSGMSALGPLCEEFARLNMEEKEEKEKKEKEMDAEEVKEDKGLIASIEETKFYDEPLNYSNFNPSVCDPLVKTPESSTDTWDWGENLASGPIISTSIDENAESLLLIEETIHEQWLQEEVGVERELIPATRRADGSIRKARYKKVGYQNAEDLAKEKYVPMGLVEKKTEEMLQQKKILSKNEARMMVLEHYRPDVLEKEKAQVEIQKEKKREEEEERKKRVLEDYATIEMGALSLLRYPPRRHVKLVSFVAPEIDAVESLAKEILDEAKKVQKREPRRFRMLLSHAGNVGSSGGALFPQKFIFFSDWVWELCRKKQKAMVETENNSEQPTAGEQGESSEMGKLS